MSRRPALYAGYGDTIKLSRGYALAVHPSGDGRVVTLEYEVHECSPPAFPCDNRFVSIAFIKNPGNVRWRDYMDSLAT